MNWFDELTKFAELSMVIIKGELNLSGGGVLQFQHVSSVMIQLNLN